MEHLGYDVVIQNGIITVNSIQNYIDPVYRFPQDSSSEDTGNIQVSCYFSGQRESTVFHVILKIISIFLFDGCVSGKAIALIYNTLILGLIGICQLKVNRISVLLFVECVLMPYAFEGDGPRWREHADLVLVPIITGRSLNIFDFHVEVLMELIVQSIKVLL